MTVSNNVNKTVQNGNGVSTSFPFTFQVSETDGSDLEIYITDTDGNTGDALTTNYLVTLTDEDDLTAGGTVTYPYPTSGTKLATGEKITIMRKLAITQDLVLTNSGPFMAENIANTMDKLVMISQQLHETAERTLKADVSVTTSANYQLPAPLAGKVIGWDDTATKFYNYDNPATATIQAVASAAAAAISESNAATSESNAAISESNAESAKDLAQLYANEDEDVEVTSGEYSAKHYSLKALNAMTSKADITYVDDLLDSIVSGAPAGVYATLTDLETAFPTGDDYIYVVTADGEWYYWNGSAWTSGGTYQSTGIGSKTVSLYTVKDELYKSVTGVKASYKANSGLIAYVRFSYDTNGLGLTNSDMMHIKYTAFISDTNLHHCYAKTYLSNSATVISGGVNFNSTSQAVTYNDFFDYDKDVANFNTTYRYIHCLVAFNMTANNLSKFFVKDVVFTAGAQTLTLMSHGLYNADLTVSSNSLITDSVYLDDAYYTRAAFDASNVCTKGAESETWSRLHTKHESGTTMYLDIVYDLNSIISSLTGSVVIKNQFKFFSDDTRLNSMTGEIFMSDSAVAGTLGNYTQQTPYNTFSTYSIGTLQDMLGWSSVTWSNPNSYRYLHYVLNINGDDMTDYYDINLLPVVLTVNGTSFYNLTDFVPYAAYPESVARLGPLDDGYVTYEIMSNEVKSKWFNKPIVTYGDSITHYDLEPFNSNHSEYGQTAKGYQSYMREKLGCLVTNRGSGGKTMSQIYGIISGATDLDTFEAITITSGANDHLQNVALGSLASIGATFNTNTFYGALQASVEFAYAENPSIKVYLITPIPGFYDSTTSTYNHEPKISVDFVNAFKAVGELYSIPVCDWYNTVGINSLNKSVYIGDLPSIAYDLHPTQAGFARMGEIIVPFLNNY